MQINEIAREVHQNSVNKGFYEDQHQNVGEKLMLTVSEISEALEAHRNGKRADLATFEVLSEDNEDCFESNFKTFIKDSFEDELADAVIRLLDLAQWQGIDIQKHIELKHKYNTTRPYKHNKAY